MTEKFNIRNLSVLSYANGFTQWHYKSDNLAACRQQDFFLGTSDMIAPGDCIIVSGRHGGCVLFVLLDGAPHHD